MKFSEYALGLKAFLSSKNGYAEYFVEIIGNFIKNDALDNCNVLNTKKDTQYRYIRGNPIKRNDAMYIYQQRDSEKYKIWIFERVSETDSFNSVSEWLKKHNYPGKRIDEECENLLEEILIQIINKNSISEEQNYLINQVDKKIKNLPKPTELSVPQNIYNFEQVYINELLAAYTEDCDSKIILDIKDLNDDYKEDLDERRIDFYAAESIKRSVRELNIGNGYNQFDILKEETLSGVKDTARKRYINGYERMLSVMEQAILLPLDKYILKKSPYWISGKIRKGVCHHLVNDGKLKWVKKK